MMIITGNRFFLEMLIFSWFRNSLLLREAKAYYYITHYSPQFDPILSQLNPFYTFRLYFSIYCNKKPDRLLRQEYQNLQVLDVNILRVSNDGDEWQASRSVYFTPRLRAAANYWIAG